MMHWLKGVPLCCTDHSSIGQMLLQFLNVCVFLTLEGPSFQLVLLQGLSCWWFLNNTEPIMLYLCHMCNEDA